MMGRMQYVAQMFGVTETSIELVERLYLEYLDALAAHFENYPYLLGWRPCIGDFGLLAPMYAHLGRDPYPALLMQQRAVRVYRWVERMNRADQDAPEYFEAGTDFLSEDEVPDTLLAVLRVLAEDFVPETRAAAECINGWLSSNQPYRFYLLQRVQGIYDDLEADDRAAVKAMLESCDMAEILTIRLDRQLGRADNLEVWL